MATQYGSNFRGGSVPLEDILLNTAENTGSFESANIRNEFGSFPFSLAVKVCDWSQDLSESDISEIRLALESASSDDKTSMRWLANSVSRVGVTEAITVYSIGEKLVVSKGNRRYTAACIARRVQGSSDPKAIKCLNTEKSKLNAGELLLAQFTENSGKLEFNVIEEATLLSGMIREFATEEKVCELTGYSLFKLQEILSVLNLSAQAQNALKAGQLKKSVAIDFIKQVENETPNPLTAARTASEAIVSAVEKAASQGKNKASLKDVQAEVSGEGGKLSKKELLLDGAAILNEVDFRNLSDTQILAVLRLLGLDRENSAFRAELLGKLGE